MLQHIIFNYHYHYLKLIKNHNAYKFNSMLQANQQKNFKNVDNFFLNQAIWNEQRHNMHWRGRHWQ